MPKGMRHAAGTAGMGRFTGAPTLPVAKATACRVRPGDGIATMSLEAAGFAHFLGLMLGKASPTCRASRKSAGIP